MAQKIKETKLQVGRDWGWAHGQPARWYAD